MARTESILDDNEIALLQALDALANSGASQAIRKSGATTLANVDVVTGSFADNETPTGAINGSNTSFTVANTVSPAGSLKVYLNGVRQRSGASNDYTFSGSTLTLSVAPASGDTLVVDYRY